MGGGTGGSSAGEIAYPAYMEAAHGNWLDNAGADTMALSVVDLMNTAQAGVSPFAGFATADSALVMGAAAQVLTPFQAVEDLDALNLQNIFDAFFLVLDDAVARAAIVAAEAALLDARMIADVLPEFQRGMRDIGAVLTTGFTLGEANMRARENLAVAKLAADLALQSRQMGWQLSMQWTQLNLEWNRLTIAMAAEVSVRYLEARYKGDQLDMEMGAKDVLFDLEVYQYGSNVMASIAGATASNKPETSMVATALGNVASGAASGAMLVSAVPSIGTALAGAFGGGAAAPVAMATGGMIASTAGSGMAAGAVGGPPGMLIGAGIGALLGLAMALF